MTLNTPTPVDEQLEDAASLVYFPNEVGPWTLDTARTTTDNTGRPIVKELCYTTTLQNRTYSIYIEKDGIGYGGILHDITNLESDPHSPPIEKFYAEDALTLDEMMDWLAEWLENGLGIVTR